MPLKCPIARAKYRKEYKAKNRELVAKQKADSYQRNKEKAIATQKAYNIKNKEAIKIQHRIYHQEYSKNNKEKIRERGRLYNLINKEAVLKRARIYNQTPNGKKYNTINNWKSKGLILQEGQRHEDIYERYINTHKCDVCNTPFKSTFYRCMDHSHVTGHFRQILCRNCNTTDNWKKKVKHDARIIIYRTIIRYR